MILSFSNFLDEKNYNFESQPDFQDKDPEYIINGVYLAYVQWLIAKVKENTENAQHYTATELLAQLHLIGLYCRQSSADEAKNWRDADISNVKAGFKAKISAYDKTVYTGVLSGLQADQKKIHTKWKRHQYFSLALLLSVFVAGILFENVYSLPISGEALISLFVVSIIVAWIYNIVSSAFERVNRNEVESPDPINPGHSAFQVLSLGPDKKLVHVSVPEKLPTLEAYTTSKYNEELLSRKKALSENAVATLLQDVDREDIHPAASATTSQMVVQRYGNLYTKADPVTHGTAADEPDQWITTDMGEDKPLDLEALETRLSQRLGS